MAMFVSVAKRCCCKVSHIEIELSGGASIVSVAKRCCCKVSPICTKKIKKAIVKFQLLSDVVVKCR